MNAEHNSGYFSSVAVAVLKVTMVVVSHNWSQRTVLCSMEHCLDETSHFVHLLDCVLFIFWQHGFNLVNAIADRKWGSSPKEKGKKQASSISFLFWRQAQFSRHQYLAQQATFFNFYIIYFFIFQKYMPQFFFTDLASCRQFNWRQGHTAGWTGDKGYCSGVIAGSSCGISFDLGSSLSKNHN